MMKKVMIQFSFPGLSLKTFDKAWDECRANGYANPKGLLHHVAGLNGNNVVVTDVWESIEAFNKFGEFLMPLLKRVGFPESKPLITPVHFEYYGAGAVSGRKAA
jgi:hypothetical protein